MSYINVIKNYEIHQEATVTSQTITNSYTELNGTRVSYTPKSYNSNIIISYSQSFYAEPDWDSIILLKLQESTDNFASDIQDVSGSHTRVQALGPDNHHYDNGVDSWSYENQLILESWNGKKYFRLLSSSEDTTAEYSTQHIPIWNGGWNSAYPPVSVLIKEI